MIKNQQKFQNAAQSPQILRILNNKINASKAFSFRFTLKFLEPIGLKAPSFSNDVKSISITREVNHAFELSGKAQGYPAPSFR